MQGFTHNYRGLGCSSTNERKKSENQCHLNVRGNCNDWIPSVFPLTSRRLMPKPFRLAISLERNATYARLFFYFYPSCQKTWKAIAQVRRVKEGHFQRPPKKRQNAAYSECDDFPISYKWCLNSIIIDLHRGRPEKKSLVKSKEKVGGMAPSLLA